MAKTLEGIALPNGLIWDDEFKWTQTNEAREYGCDGALMIHASTKQAGRPITLAGADDAGWVDRATLLALYALTAAAENDMTLVWHERTFTVRWDFEAEPITAKMVMREGIPDAETLYSITLRLIQVA